MVKFFVLCLLVAFSASRAFKIFPLPAISRNQHQLWKPIPRRNPSRTLRVQCESPNHHHDDSCKQKESEFISQVASTNNETVNGNATTEVQALDPTQIALKEKEERLTKELQAWQDTLVSERIHLLEVRDKLFGSGKDAYYAVQAEVNDFVRNRDAAQKADVSRNKRLFVEKMLPIVDAFRHASAITPTSTPKIESMHTNYGSLLNYILMVFAKYGYQEFAPAVGDALDATQHEVLEVREPSTALEVPSNSTHAPPVPVVVEVLRTGWRDAAQTVLRKSTVAASGALNATSTDGNATLEDANGAQPLDNANNDNEGPTTGEGAVMEVTLNAERFYQRLERLQTEWMSHKSTVWGGSDALCIPLGAIGDEINYSKSSSFHLFLFGYEFADSLIVITRNNFYFMATAKKCAMLEKDLAGKHDTIKINLMTRTKDEGQNREFFNELGNVVRKGGGKRIGSLFKSEYEGNFIPSWMNFVDQSQLEKFDIAPSLGLFLSTKDDVELDLCKRAAVLSNKVMKHGFVQEMESILDNETKITHDELAKKVEEIILDPSKINIKVSADAVDACYTPIIQSGGVYDIKPSAVSDEKRLSADVILCSIGARYKGYCANVSRTFMVDAPKKVEKTYATFVALYDACLEQMIPGNELKNVLDGAKAFLRKRDPELLNHLPKSLGFAVGLEFRDSSMLLNGTNTNKFTPNMVFNLSVGLHNIPLSEEDKKGSPDSVQKLTVFSLLLADVVSVQAEGVPEVLTKISKEFGDVSYNIGGKDDEEEDEVVEVEEDGAPRRSGRAKEEKIANELSAASRARRQQELMEKRLAEARRRQLNGDGSGNGNDEGEQVEAKELAVYRSKDEYPRDIAPNRLKVDLEKECLILPINGQLVPFHISTIKSMTQPDPDMRINFYIPGSALGKEVPKNMQQLVIKYGGTAMFIKELTFRSLDGKNLPTVYQQFQELRRRIRQREQKAEQEKDLVVQTKLIRIKDQRVPRLQEVTMRPQLSGRKCIGTLEAHQNGLRFTSSKAEILDVMYGNIKHAIFQPCDRTTMVLVHFHLKDFILIGKKKHKDVQFYTEVIESSLNLEGSHRSSYDPDELDDEQREREMRKRLNLAFKEFCSKVEKVAAHYEFNLNVDVPFKKSGFLGNWSKEMVLLQPTTNCLVNLTEWPSFVMTLSEVEHAHFERVTYATKAFDVTFVFKNWDIVPRTITAIDMKYMDIIQDWLNLVEITFTKGPRSINWTDIMKIIRDERATFYDDVDEEGVSKPAGWLFLSAEGSDSEEEGEEDEDSNFSGDEDDSDESESESDSDDESDFSEEDSDGSFDEDEEEGLEEKGMDWDELEQDAKKADAEKRKNDHEEPVKSSKKARR